jgi:hypothetical protein
MVKDITNWPAFFPANMEVDGNFTSLKAWILRGKEHIKKVN